MRRLPEALGRPFAVALVVATLYAAYAGAKLYASGWDVTTFIVAGDAVVDPRRTPSPIRVRENSAGYDGQYYYRVALDPFPTEPVKFGVTLDRPAYRSQRVLYPLVARLLAFGRPALVPWTLVLVNLIAVAAIGYAGAAAAKRFGVDGWFGLTLGLYPGLLLSFSRNLTEPLALALVLVSLLLLGRSKHVAATVVLALAVLARETALLVAGVAAVLWLLSRRRSGVGLMPQVPWHYFVVPAVVFVVWQGALWANWGQVALLGGSGTPRNLPLTGIWDGFLLASRRGAGLPWLWLLEVAYLIALWVAGGWVLRRSPAGLLEKGSFVLFVLLCLVLSGPLWEEDWGFLRIGVDAAVLGTLVLVVSRSRMKVPALVATGAVWAALAVLYYRA